MSNFEDVELRLFILLLLTRIFPIQKPFRKFVAIHKRNFESFLSFNA